MIEDIPVAVFDNLGAVAVVLIVGFMVATGRLVPRRFYEDKEHEASEWRSESRIKDQQIAEKDAQLRHLEEVGRTMQAVLRAINAAARRSDR